jgi:MFS family permease
MSPTHAGLLSVAMVGGLLVSSIGTGRIITRTGRWKRYLVGGMVLVVVGLSLLSTIDEATSLVRVGSFMAVLGVGLGATMQNLVLSVQNNTAQRDMGAASSVVAFFRSMGGSIGVSALGAALSHQVATKIASGLAALGIKASATGDSSAIPDVSSLPGPIRGVVEAAFGQGIAYVFLLAVPFAVAALVAVLFIREVPLRTTIEREDVIEERPEGDDQQVGVDGGSTAHGTIGQHVAARPISVDDGIDEGTGMHEPGRTGGQHVREDVNA